MESDEEELEEQEDSIPICLQDTPGQNVYTKCIDIPVGTLPDVDKHIKVGVVVSLDDGTSDQRTTEGPSQVNAVGLPNNVHISDLPENVTLETEYYETEHRKIMRMKLRPEANTFFKHETIKFNLICNYTPDEDGEHQSGMSDDGHSGSSGEMGTDYFSDEETEQSRPNDKGVQTDIALGDLLFSDSIASVSHGEVDNVAVQTYITTADDQNAGEEEEEQDLDTEEEGLMDEYEAEHADDAEKTSAGESQQDEQEDGHCPCREKEKEKEKDKEEGEYFASKEEKYDEMEEKQKEDDEAEGDKEEPPTEKPRLPQRKERASDTTTVENPQGIPLCLLRGDPPWVDPLVDTYTIMWDTNLEVDPKDVKLQFKDTVNPMPSGMKIPEKDPLQQLRRSSKLSATFPVKLSDSDQSYFGSFIATSLSSNLLKRDPELFNIHIDLNTWGFPAALYERYAKSTTPSIATLFDDQPSSGELLFITDEALSIHSIYNPDIMADTEDPADTMSVGFFIEDGKPIPSTMHQNLPTKVVDALEEPKREEVSLETPMASKQASLLEGPRSISEEYLSTAEDLQSSTHSSSEDLKEREEEVSVSPNLPLSLVIAINDSRPLILLLDPQDLPITIAIGTKNVPVNNASAACAIKKLGGNMFHVNNIDLKETAVTNLELEKTESDKVRCNVTVDGNVKGQTIADLGTLGSTVLLNLPLEQAKATQKMPQGAAKTQNNVNYCQVENFPLSTIETEEGAFELQWQKGLPVSEDISPHRTYTSFLHPVNKNEPQTHPSTRNEVLRSVEDKKAPYTPERIKRKTGCTCKPSILDTFSRSAPSSLYCKPSKKLGCGVLNKTLTDIEKQISPLNKALDDIKSRMQALEVENPGIILNPTYSKGSSMLSRTDSGYEQEISELISSVQKEAIAAKFPCVQKSSSHIQCVRDPSTELFTPCSRKPCLRTDSCSMSGYMIQQSAAFNMPLDVDITYIVPAPIEMVTTTAWPNSSLCRTSSELGCPGGFIPSSKDHLAPKKMSTFCSMWTNAT